MNCSACAKPNADGISFCEFCGANLRSQPGSTGGPDMARSAPAQPAPPSAAQVAQMGKSLLGTLTLGEKFIGAGTIAAVLGFFLPWISTSGLENLPAGIFGNLGAEASHLSISGVDAAKVVGSVYFILLAGIAFGSVALLLQKVAV